MPNSLADPFLQSAWRFQPKAELWPKEVGVLPNVVLLPNAGVDPAPNAGAD